MNSSLQQSIFLVAVQGFCAAIFFMDVVTEIIFYNQDIWHLMIEIIASVSLMVALILESKKVAQILQYKTSLERTLTNASLSVHEVIEKLFYEWHFSPSECDIAGLVVKGLSTEEIATVRGTSEGTVKSQLNSIYRKADARNRSDLMTHILDAMIDRPLLDAKLASADRDGPAQSGRSS